MARKKREGPPLKIGRKQKLTPTPENLKKIEELAFKTASQRAVAWHMDIDESTWYDTIKIFPELIHAYNRGRAKATDFSGSKLMRAVEAGEAWAIKFHLTYRGDFVKDLNLNINNGSNTTPPAIQLKNLDPVEASRIYQKIMND